MAGDTEITVVGNMVADPELRFTASGAAVVNLTVASTPRQFEKNSNEWKDGETLFLRCSGWRDMAENVAESLQKGMRIIVQGRLKSRSYETKEGDRRTVIELDIEEIGPSLKYATAKVVRKSKGSGGGFGQGSSSQGAQRAQGGFGAGPGGSGQGGGFGGSQAAQGDPWGQSQGSLGGDSWGNEGEPPPF